MSSSTASGALLSSYWWILVPALILLSLDTKEGRAFLRDLSATIRNRPLLGRGTDLATILQASPFDFEVLCRDVLRGQGFAAVTTAPSADGGVDIELQADDGRIGLAQCKRWTRHGVGRPVLQQLVGEMANRKAAFGVVITTSRFSRGLREKRYGLSTAASSSDSSPELGGGRRS